MPVFTAAPLPLLYGWRMTRAPAASARAAVASVEPSSTTSTSRHGAAWRSIETTPAIASCSFMAGRTTETSEASAKQLLHDAVPGDGPRPRQACRAEALCPLLSVAARELHGGGGDRGRLRRANVAVDVVRDELQRSAGVGGGD